MTASATLDRAAIARRIPHSGSMCLLDACHAWDATRIQCSSQSHRSADNPLRTAQGLLAPNLIEYAAQAMALHGGLLAPADSEPSAGFLASARNVRFGAFRIDDIDGALDIQASRISGDANQVMYEFAVRDAQGRSLAEGRAVVVLNTPLAS